MTPYPVPKFLEIPTDVIFPDLVRHEPKHAICSHSVIRGIRLVIYGHICKFLSREAITILPVSSSKLKAKRQVAVYTQVISEKIRRCAVIL